MSKVEKHLHEHFASLAEQNGTEDDGPNTTEAAPTSQQDPASLRDYVPEALDDPFAKVNTVAPSSPAATAGLQPGDLIRNFGWVNKSNHDDLKKVAECVQGNEGVGFLQIIPNPLHTWAYMPVLCVPAAEYFEANLLILCYKRNVLVKVSRVSAAPSQRELQLTLVPRRDWGGRGLLGCHILPL